MKCRNIDCGEEVSLTALFCGKCGTSVRSHCSECNEVLPIRRGLRFCGNCGKLISEMREVKPLPNKPEQPETDALSGDIRLEFESISLYPHGHVGSETVYVHEKRIVTNQSWGVNDSGEQVDSRVKILEIPAHITTEQELRAYVQEHEPYWIRSISRKSAVNIAKQPEKPRDGGVDGTLHLRSEPIYVGGETKRTDAEPADKLKTNRSLGMFILLSIVTFGIYPIIFFSSIGSDLNKIASRYDGKKTMHFCLVFFILSIITFGIATLIWFHRMSDRIGGELQRRGYEKTIGSDTYWLWGIIGSLIIVGPFIYVYKLAGAMNTLSMDYNSHG